MWWLDFSGVEMKVKRKCTGKNGDIAIPKTDGGLGFRDFLTFNQSLLAKQSWRLLTNPNSLCGRVVKGKYFHNCDFMNARKKRNSSHVWRAILHGRLALKVGIIKRVGDGATIRP